MPEDKASFLGLDINYVQDDRTVITVGAPDFASATPPNNLKSKNPRKTFRNFSIDPLVSFIEFDLSAIDDDRLNVGGFALVNHNLNGFAVGAGPLFTKTSAGSYTLKFHRSKIYHRLYPEAILSSANLTGTVSRVQENPANKLTDDWLTAIVSADDTFALFSFENGIPALTVGPIHKFHVLVRKTSVSGPNPSVRLTLYNSGVALSAPVTTIVTSTISQLATLSSDVDITTIPTNNIELLVEGLSTATDTVEIGAVMFMPIHSVDHSVTSAVPLPSYPYRTHLYIHHFLDESLDGTKYILFEPTTTDPAMTYFEFGSAIISPVIVSPHHIDWGSGGITLTPPSPAALTPLQSSSGAEYFRAQGRVRRRKMSLLLDDVLETQALRDFWGYALAKHGITGVFYGCINPQSSFVNEKSIYGRIIDPFELQPKSADEGQLAYPLNLQLLEVVG